MLHRTSRLFLTALASAACGSTAVLWAAAAEPAPAVDFQRDVRPILSDNCFACHGPDEATREADLRLDTRDGAFSERPPAGRSTRPRGPAVVPGDLDASLLVERINHTDALRRMPPEVSQKSLSDDQIATLTRWVEQGAPWAQHWSFVPPTRPQAPPVERTDLVRNAIDRFVLRQLEDEGLSPQPEATREAFRGGWFHSGDLAVVHGDGYVEVRDRAKDIIISGGENISSIEVEDVLHAHPAVMEAAVVGRAHPKWGERPVAFVSVSPGNEPPGEKDLRSFCRERLAGYKVPDDFVFGELPKTSTGKVRKTELRERAAMNTAEETPA